MVSTKYYILVAKTRQYIKVKVILVISHFELKLYEVLAWVNFRVQSSSFGSFIFQFLRSGLVQEGQLDPSGRIKFCQLSCWVII